MDALQASDFSKYSQEDAEYLEGEYSLNAEYPDYIEEGYVSIFIELNCSHLGFISVISSDFMKFIWMVISWENFQERNYSE